MTDIHVDIIDFFDLINETLSSSFVEKWRFKYSEKFIKLFQLKITDSLSKGKPLKLSVLFNYLTKKGKYNEDQVLDFFSSIEIDIYRPFIQGSISDLSS